MIYLQVGGWQCLQIDEAAASVFLDERFLDDLRKSSAPFQPPEPGLAQRAEAIGRDLAPVTAHHAERLDGYPALAHVAGGAGRVSIAILFRQFLGSDVPMLEDVINNRFWTLCDDLAAKREKFFWQFGHTVAGFPGVEAVPGRARNGWWARLPAVRPVPGIDTVIPP